MNDFITSHNGQSQNEIKDGIRYGGYCSCEYGFTREYNINKIKTLDDQSHGKIPLYFYNIIK